MEVVFGTLIRSTKRRPTMPDWIRQHPAGWFTLVVMGGGFTLYVTNRLHAAGMLAWVVVMLVCITFGPAVDEVVGGR